MQVVIEIGGTKKDLDHMSTSQIDMTIEILKKGLRNGTEDLRNGTEDLR